MNDKKILSIASDHGGYTLRLNLLQYLRENAYTVFDYGPTTRDQKVDYPDYAKLVAEDIINKKADVGILICTTGIGISISANKFKGIRAALVNSEDAAEFSRKHNDANVICFGGKYTTHYLAVKFLEIFLKTPFEGGRHQKRVDKIG